MRKLPLAWLISISVLALGLVTPEDAGASGKMYWADALTVKIQRADLDGSNVEDLITTGLSKPHGIALWSCPGSVDGQALGFVDLRSGSLSYAIGDK